MNLDFAEKLPLYRFRYAIAYSALVIVSATVLVIALNTLVPGISKAEAKYALSSIDLGNLVENPLNFIYRLLQWATIQLFGPNGWGVRLPGAILGAILLAIVFATINIWHKHRIAIIATGLAATSSWFLHSSRIGLDVIMLPLSIMLMIFAASALKHSEQRAYSRWLTLLAFTVAIYTPLMIYLVLLFLFLYRRELSDVLQSQSKIFLGSVAVISALLISPLAIALVRDPDLIIVWLGLPDALPTLGDIFSNINNTFAYMFWRADENALLHVGTLPMLDIFTATMTALGLYHYERHGHHLRTRFVMGGFFASLAVVSFMPNQANYALLMPFIFIFAATGVITLLTQWYMIFPRNPVARASAIIPMAILLLAVGGYHLERYFYAWANNSNTSTVFIAESTVVRQQVIIDEAKTLIVTDGDRQDIIKLSISDQDNLDAIHTSQLDEIDLNSYQRVLVSEGLSTPEQLKDSWQNTDPLRINSIRRAVIFETYSPLSSETNQ